MDVRRTPDFDLLAHTTSEEELLAELCTAAQESDEVEFAWIELSDDAAARAADVTARTSSFEVGTNLTLTVQATSPEALTEAELRRLEQLVAAVVLIRQVRVTVTSRFRRALAGSEVSLFVMNRELRYTWLEAPSLGIGDDTALGRTDAEILPAGTAAQMTALKRRVIEHGEHVAQEVAVGDRFFWVSARPIRDAGGEITGLAGQAVNVTARKYAERELDRIASAAEHGTDAVISLDTTGRVQRWNRSAERLFGYNALEARGKTLQELGPADGDDDDVAQRVAQVLAERRPIAYDAVRRRRDGAQVDLRVTLAPWEVDDELVGVTGIAVDITQRRQAERDRETAIAGLHEAQQLARVGSWWFDSQTRELQWSPQMYEIYGLPPTAKPREARDLLEYIHPEDRDGIGAQLQTMTDGGPDFDHEHRIIGADGTERVVRAIARRDVRRPGRFFGTVQDVTERRRLRELDALFTIGFTVSPMGMVLLTEEGTVLQANRSLARMLGYADPEQLVGLPWQQLVHPDDLAKLAGMGEALRSRDEIVMQVRYRKADGEPVDGVSATSAVQVAPGRPPVIFSQILDVTARVRTERDLAESEARYRRILETTLEGVWTFDAGHVTTFANRAMAEMLDSDPAAMIGRPLSDFLDGDPDLRRGGHRELALRSATGRAVWALVAANPMLDADGSYLGALAMVTDISERRQMELRLQHLADHDHLTGIFNRRRLLEELDEHLRMAARTGRGGAALVLDLDHFKFINDTRGHAAGDAVLRTVGEALRARLRSTDVVARLGGDEFAAVLPELSAEEALALAQQLLRLLADRDSPIASSIGVVQFTGAEELTADEILVCADTALYEAKEHGGAQARLYTGQATGALHWVQRIRTAMATDRLVLYGQPILDLRSGLVAKHELLVRMLGDDGEVIAPGEFLPTAERFGLIRELDAWVTRRGLALAASGRPVAINLSGYSVEQTLIVAQVRGALVGGLDPANVTFEITETAALTNLEAARHFVESLATLGFSVALDDFGTGFGSFIYLKHIPARFLKIDMEFVRGVLDSPVDQEVVRSIVGIARALGKETIAEGVEDLETLELLRTYGVDYVQGFAIGRPAPFA